MDEKQRDVLQKSHDYLIQNITALPLIDSLYSAGVLMNDDCIRLRRVVTPNDQCRLLLVDMLPKAGPDAFSTLVTALRETDQSYAAEYLLEQLRTGIHSTLFVAVFVGPNFGTESIS